MKPTKLTARSGQVVNDVKPSSDRRTRCSGLK